MTPRLCGRRTGRERSTPTHEDIRHTRPRRPSRRHRLHGRRAPSPDIAAIVADPARPASDRQLDASRHPAELLALLDLKPGQTVADIWPGDYWDRLFADAVGPTGTVYAAHLADADEAEKHTTPPAGSMPLPEHPNVVVAVTRASSFSLPAKADVIWFRQNYHDLYDKFMGPADVPAFNKAVYNALKPGGRFVIIDHSAVARIEA